MTQTRTFAWTRGAEGLRQIAAPWQELADSLPDAEYFQRPQWYEAYLQLSEAPQDMVWITVHEQGQLKAVLPLQQLKRRMGPLTVRELRLVNHGHMTLADVCADRRDTTLWPELWRWLHGRQAPDWDRLVVTHTPADGVLAGWMQQQPPAHLLQSVASSSARVDCRRSLDELLKACGGNHRSNLSRRSKRAEAMGPLRYELARTPEELARLMPVFMSLEASGWKGKAGSAVASTPKVQAFYDTLLDGFGRRGECEIDVLYVGDRAVASVLWFRTARQIHLQKIGYLEELSDLSPGKLLMRESFRRACADPSLDRLCFITHPDWADPWKPEGNPVLEFSAFSNGLKGSLLFQLNRTKRNRQARRAEQARQAAAATPSPSAPDTSTPSSQPQAAALEPATS